MLDKLDRKLVVELQKEGRESFVTLAKALGVSERTVRNRLTSLLERNIVKITAVPNLEALGYKFVGIVGIQVQLTNLSNIAATLGGHPNVVYLANVTGRYDLILIVVTTSSLEFARFMETVVSRIQGILRTETFVTLHSYKGDVTGLDTERLINNLGVSSTSS
jgi:DNA-binding Lrp family transcriptional regulator